MAFLSSVNGRKFLWERNESDISSILCACSIFVCVGTRWRTRLGHYATSKKVVGSIPDKVTAVFSNDLILPAASMAIGSTQPLTEMCTKNLAGRKRATDA
jgi:hypothetical protein